MVPGAQDVKVAVLRLYPFFPPAQMDRNGIPGTGVAWPRRVAANCKSY
jgi:hypothetical protein